MKRIDEGKKKLDEKGKNGIVDGEMEKRGKGRVKRRRRKCDKGETYGKV